MNRSFVGIALLACRILKGTIIIPKSDEPQPGDEAGEEFEFLKEFQIARMQTERNYVIFLNEAAKTATFTEHRQAKVFIARSARPLSVP